MGQHTRAHRRLCAAQDHQGRFRRVPIPGGFKKQVRGIANPIGTFWSSVMMLEHLGEQAAAGRLMKAIERVTANPKFHTPDLGGNARTADVTAGVIEAIRGAND